MTNAPAGPPGSPPESLTSLLTTPVAEPLVDAGAQAERTALAWQRTGLAAVAVGALFIRAIPAGSSLAPWPGIALIAVGALAAAILAPVRYARVLVALRSGRTPASAGTVLGVTVAVIIVLVGTGVAVLP